MLKDDWALLEPIRSSSSFSSEYKKYARVSKGKTVDGSTVVFDDSKSVEFSLGSKEYYLVPSADIIAKIDGEV